MRKLSGSMFFVMVSLCAMLSRQAVSADVYQQFNAEEIKPYIKVIKGPWVNNVVTGGPGAYRLTVKLPENTKEYVLGLFDHKINRSGADERCAVVLFDGVNPLAPSETVSVNDIETSDLSWMRKVPFDGLTFNSRDASDKDCCVKVVDTKEEFEFGPVKPFKVPSGRSGTLGRVDIVIFKGPANPPTPGQVIDYGKPINRFIITLSE